MARALSCCAEKVQVVHRAGCELHVLSYALFHASWTDDGQEAGSFASLPGTLLHSVVFHTSPICFELRVWMEKSMADNEGKRLKQPNNNKQSASSASDINHRLMEMLLFALHSY